ncbi:HNH endonuclease [Oligoflexia bacterium]|nr:HNH endonuclease [Oligoflexia bacterium]
MLKSFTNYSDQKLIDQLKRLVKREDEATAQIIAHLAEVEGRKLHLTLGHNSLFSYCTSRLKYSEGAANRRITAARCIRRFPKTFDMLCRKELNLSTICIISKVLNHENQEMLLSKVAHKSQSETEQVVCTYSTPKPKDVKDQIKPIALQKVEIANTLPFLSEQDELHDSTVAEQASNQPLKSASAGNDALNHRRSGGNATVYEEKMKITFSAKKEFVEKLQKVQRLLSNKYPTGADLENLFNEALEYYIKLHCPEEKAQCNQKRREKGKEKCRKEREVDNKIVTSQSVGSKKSRYIPVKVKDKVLKRDNYCCSYVSPDGHRCASKWGLELDHIYPFALGGENTPHNLRVLCKAHNGHEAKKIFGSEYVESFYKQRLS